MRARKQNDQYSLRINFTGQVRKAPPLCRFDIHKIILQSDRVTLNNEEYQQRHLRRRQNAHLPNPYPANRRAADAHRNLVAELVVDIVVLFCFYGPLERHELQRRVDALVYGIFAMTDANGKRIGMISSLVLSPFAKLPMKLIMYCYTPKTQRRGERRLTTRSP